MPIIEKPDSCLPSLMETHHPPLADVDMVDVNMVDVDMVNRNFWSISYIWEVYQGSYRGPV